MSHPSHYSRRQVDEQPSERYKKNDDKSAVAMLKKHELQNVWQPVFKKAIARHTKIRDQNPSLGYICPGEPHERSPNAPKFEDRSQEEIEWQELGAREAAWKLAKNVFKLKRA